MLRLLPNGCEPKEGAVAVFRYSGNFKTRSKITGDEGKYDTHGTVTEPGIHRHINYLDYQAWLYQKKLRQLGIADNTVFIFCADNGTSGYGKNSPDGQKGTHVPLIIHAPGMTKHGQQDVLVNLSDMLPTISELTGVELPGEYEINGESLVPFLYTDMPDHRQWLYGYLNEKQIIRGKKVMRDGRGKWWDVESTPEDLISFPPIANWAKVSAAHRAERDQLIAILPRFDQETHGKNAPSSHASIAAEQFSVVFEDDFEGRREVGERYTTGRGYEAGWRVAEGVLSGMQVKANHGSTIRTELDFDDVDMQFDFCFRGGKSFNFVMDDANEKSVHAGHICRVSVFRKRIQLSDDKTGSMNLEVRKQRKEKALSHDDAKSLEELLARTRSSARISIEEGRWHNLRIRIRSDKMDVFLDGELTSVLQSPGIDHPTKNKLGFTVNGDRIEFDNLQVKTILQ